MTSGIYILKFKGTEYVYVGKSLNIEGRFKDHITTLRNNNGSIKLQAAYLLFGTPILEIVCETVEPNLDKEEAYYCSLYDSIRCGFNTVDITGRGLYKEKYITAFHKCVAFAYLPTSKIAEESGISNEEVRGIRYLKKCSWLKEEYPEEYALLEEYNLTIYSKLSKPTIIKKSKEYYPTLISPEGEEVVIEKGNLNTFCKENNIPYTALNKVLNSKLPYVRGWTLA